MDEFVGWAFQVWCVCVRVGKKQDERTWTKSIGPTTFTVWNADQKDSHHVLFGLLGAVILQRVRISKFSLAVLVVSMQVYTRVVHVQTSYKILLERQQRNPQISIKFSIFPTNICLSVVGGTCYRASNREEVPKISKAGHVLSMHFSLLLPLPLPPNARLWRVLGEDFEQLVRNKLLSGEIIPRWSSPPAAAAPVKEGNKTIKMTIVCHIGRYCSDWSKGDSGPSQVRRSRCEEGWHSSHENAIHFVREISSSGDPQAFSICSKGKSSRFDPSFIGKWRGIFEKGFPTKISRHDFIIICAAVYILHVSTNGKLKLVDQHFKFRLQTLRRIVPKEKILWHRKSARFKIH